MYLPTRLQQTTEVEYALVDKTKKVTQEENKPVIEYDDASMENKVSVQYSMCIADYLHMLVCTFVYCILN